ncbi:hypothetical protein [Mumia sp. DW29H23]|uniref:hypothetical protein n=1 Tax=Mumia sp. DW29H23 TaxID=3421241 RepID=UPI003D69172A
MGQLRTAWAAVPLALLMACGSGAEEGDVLACTMIGSSAGIGVTVEQPLAAQADTVRLETCWGEECVAAEAPLYPGTTVVDEGCDGDEPEAACSASSTPDGTMQGFVDVAELPADEVEVTAIVQHRDGTEAHRAVVRTTAAPTYPNGKHCDPGANQAQITLP